jgi:hypothetical protein
LEFDFIPSGDSLSFNYSFGSDEYNEYVCGSVNDAFGFFLSGPGINGVYSDGAINLAIIPETDNTPVTINSVNNGNVGASGTASNCAQVDPNWMNNTDYYIDNATNSDPNATQLDGFTVSLVAAAAVQCVKPITSKLQLPMLVTPLGTVPFSSKEALFLPIALISSQPPPFRETSYSEATRLSLSPATMLFFKLFVPMRALRIRSSSPLEAPLPTAWITRKSIQRSSWKSVNTPWIFL